MSFVLAKSNTKLSQQPFSTAMVSQQSDSPISANVIDSRLSSQKLK